MASFNKVILVGNLTRDPEVKYLPSGSAVADIALAVNRSWFDKSTNEKKEEVTFVDVTLWGRTAEVAGQYLAKGRSVLIEQPGSQTLQLPGPAMSAALAERSTTENAGSS